jgi:hypothetical protein
MLNSFFHQTLEPISVDLSNLNTQLEMQRAASVALAFKPGTYTSDAVRADVLRLSKGDTETIFGVSLLLVVVPVEKARCHMKVSVGQRGTMRTMTIGGIWYEDTHKHFLVSCMNYLEVVARALDVTTMQMMPSDKADSWPGMVAVARMRDPSIELERATIHNTLALQHGFKKKFWGWWHKKL